MRRSPSDLGLKHFLNKKQNIYIYIYMHSRRAVGYLLFFLRCRNSGIPVGFGDWVVGESNLFVPDAVAPVTAPRGLVEGISSRCASLLVGFGGWAVGV